MSVNLLSLPLLARRCFCCCVVRLFKIVILDEEVAVAAELSQSGELIENDYDKTKYSYRYRSFCLNCLLCCSSSLFRIKLNTSI